MTKYPQKSHAAVCGHVLLTLLTFTPANAFRTQSGQDLAQQGIRRQHTAVEAPQVVIFAGSDDALFPSEDLFRLLGIVPEIHLHADPGPAPPFRLDFPAA